MNERTLRTTLARYSQKIWQRGWVANHDGNLSVKLDSNRFLATPSGVSKEEINEHNLIIVSEKGSLLSGKGKSFSEFAMHRAAYQQRPDAYCVIHAHPPFATGMAVAGLAFEQPLLPEAVVSLGPRIPLIPFSAPGSRTGLSMLGSYLVEYDAVLLQNHGVLTLGNDIEQAYLRMELVEHLAKILAAANQFGGAKEFDQTCIPKLLESRKKAGLGPEARGVRTRQAPAIPVASSSDICHNDLRELITREITRVISGMES